MSFFEPPPPPEPPEWRRSETPEWFGPPDNLLPGSFALERVLARTDQVALYVHGGRAYPTGIQFTLGVRLRVQRDRRRHDPMMAWHEASLEDDVLRFGIAFPDGRKATVFDRRPMPGTDAPAPDAVLLGRGGGGGGTSWEHHFWAWPLPPAGPFAFVIEWPEMGIELTRVETDSEPMREAAARTIELWPDDCRPGPGCESSAA